ncbi:MAG: ComEC/Rec2 family competence protein [Microgenomates group bacterium]
METVRISKKQLFIILIFLIIFSAISFLVYFFIRNLDQRTTLVFCNVGQGDAAYLRIKNKIDVLIDAGPDKSILSCLGKYMPFWDKKIELAFLSHPNKDHYQGFYFINDRYKIDYFITIDSPFISQAYKNLLEKLQKKQVTILKKFTDDQIKIDNDLFWFFWPDKDFVSKDDNDYSHLLLFQENDFKVLFTGDASQKILNLLANQTQINFLKNVNIIKIPHHGSKNGMNQKFLQIIRPQIAVISVGKNNSYGHPAKEVLDLLEALKIITKRTDKDGDVVFKLKN